MGNFIEPKILKGFRDFLPGAEILRRNLLEKAENCFRSYGFVPIDTPALEYAEILLGKGGGETEKQVFRFLDNGGRDVALRFDLTVPFARFLAMHKEELVFPFKRYHIAKVWRGENTQRGRYREFTQCDFDIIGSVSAESDFEIIHIMYNTLTAIAGDNIIIRINHRDIFNTFLANLEVQDKSVEILRTVDKLQKIGKEETLRQLSEIIGAAGDGENKAKKILDFISIEADFDETLRAMEAKTGPCQGVTRLAQIRRFLIDAGIADLVKLDPTITRGLDYYTGIVFECFLAELPEIGSICGGGRYDNLVGLYSKDSLPGVGAALGIDRLIAGLETLGRIDQRPSYAQAAIIWVSETAGGFNQALAAKLRKEGINCEVFLENEKLTKQYQNAEKKGIRWVIIPETQDPQGSKFTLRDLSSRQNREGLALEDVIKVISTNNHE